MPERAWWLVTVRGIGPAGEAVTKNVTVQAPNVEGAGFQAKGVAIVFHNLRRPKAVSALPWTRPANG